MIARGWEARTIVVVDKSAEHLTAARVEAALAGDLPGEVLTAEEAVVYDAEIDAHLEARLTTDDHVVRRASAGLSSVVVDDAGRLVEHRPDGTSVILEQ